MTDRLHALIGGRVQGVGFRYFVSRSVAGLDEPVHGWVRNLTDGRVEILAEGPRHALENLLIVAREGTGASKVNRVEEEWGKVTGEFGDFSIRPTAKNPGAAS
ncbi:MAG: acylphosphatase [Chloroflexi bacterium]|nr:acylphosphatase [Chloroflexota bacterium]MQC26661.1 acylphosphatase [Chloroflexota bacterium]